MIPGISWRRRLAGEFAIERSYENRRRDAGATTNLVYIAIATGCQIPWQIEDF